ncbi:MAG: T9SS type A sorting domain-containing protein, partial [Candidatus Zixiibacteriota bacterium]
VDGDNVLPSDFKLYQNYPNPFNPATIIKYSLTHKERVQLNIYNILGRKVKTLVDRIESAGQYEIVWDGTDDSHHDAASGIYFYRIIIGNGAKTRKMILLK